MDKLIDPKFTKMDPTIKTEWVAALRSGAYQQAKYKLRNSDDGFCCLGVLCELAVQAKVIELPIQIYRGYTYGQSNAGGYTAQLPPVVAQWAGITSNSYGSKPEQNLIHHNDDNHDGKTFKEIADIIEEHF